MILLRPQLKDISVEIGLRKTSLIFQTKKSLRIKEKCSMIVNLMLRSKLPQQQMLKLLGAVEYGEVEAA